jgi:hypothetical protein
VDGAVPTDVSCANGELAGPVLNLVNVDGQTCTPCTLGSYVFLNGRINIIPDGMPFRGDANVDNAVDLSDAVYTLSFLFLGGPAPSCSGAADANGDGMIDITDPIATLVTLFLGSGRADFRVLVSCTLSED